MRDVALFQVLVDKTCMSYRRFRKVMEKVIGRHVSRDEFEKRDALLKEIAGDEKVDFGDVLLRLNKDESATKPTYDLLYYVCMDDLERG